MRVLLMGSLLALAAGADPADDYFELGLDYLHKGLFARSRAALGESLVRAPAEPVTLAFLGVAAAAEGYPPAACARILRAAYRRLGSRRVLRLDLRALLPSARALRLLHEEYARKLAGAHPSRRGDLLGVLAFLEVQDGSPGSAPSLAKLLELRPRSAYALRLAQSRPKVAPES